MRALIAAVLLIGAGGTDAQPPKLFLPVGVLVGAAGAAGENRTDLLQLYKLRFNVIAWRDAATRELRMHPLARVLAQDSRAAAPFVPTDGVEVVVVRRDASAAAVRCQAWQAVARGARGVVFDSSVELFGNHEALGAAASFADNLTRNAALFAPLRPRLSQGDVRVDVGTAIVDTRFLESSVAMVFIAVNLTPSVQRATMTFSPGMPEAIWQNMEAGGAVNFVAGPEGPTYTRTFAPHDVLVLMIRKQYR